MKYAIKNLELVSETEVVVPLTNREVFFTFSVYESIVYRNGILKDPEDHLDRFLESARILRLTHSFEKEAILASLHILIQKNEIPDGTLKLQLIGGQNPLLFAFSASLPLYPEKYYTDGVKVVSYSGERIMPRVKSNCLLLNYLASRYASENGALDALLVNRDGNALEGSRCNLFAVKEKVLYTAGDNVLFGVTRGRIIDRAKKTGYSVSYTELSLDDLKSALYDEVFITSTSMGAVPVRMIDDIIIGRSFSVTAFFNKNGGL